MITLLLGKTHDGDVKIIAGPGGDDILQKFNKLVNTGRENENYSEISLFELNFSDGRKREAFRKPMTEAERKQFESQNESTRKGKLLDEARSIQQNNVAIQKQIDFAKDRLQPLSAEHEQVLTDAGEAPESRMTHRVALEDRDLDYLKALAAQEHIEVSDSATKEDLIAAINMYRDLRGKSIDDLRGMAESRTIKIGKDWDKSDFVEAIAATEIAPVDGDEKLEDLTIEDLKAVADEEEIDLTGAKVKQDYIDMIRAFRELDQKTLDELRTSATTENVDVTGLKLKKDFVNAIAAERRARSTT